MHRKIHWRAIAIAPLALGTIWAQSPAGAGAGSDSVLPALHAWPKAEVIDDLSPATLARLAAQRREREQTVVRSVIPSQSAELPGSNTPLETAPLTSAQDFSRGTGAHSKAWPPPPPSNSEIAIAAPAENQQELIATLQPLEITSASERPYLVRNNSIAGQLEVARFPYSPAQKFHLFLKNSYDPFGLISESFDALYNQAEGNPYGYGGGMEGYGKRLGAIKATDVAGEFTGTFLFPSLLRTDPRYFRMGRGGFFKRAGYALTRTLITKKDSGGETFNAANFLSGISTTAISDSYYPHRDRSFPGILQHTSVNIGFDSLNNLFNEFWPDLAQRLRIPAFIVRRTADPYFPDQN